MFLYTYLFPSGWNWLNMKMVIESFFMYKQVFQENQLEKSVASYEGKWNWKPSSVLNLKSNWALIILIVSLTLCQTWLFINKCYVTSLILVLMTSSKRYVLIWQSNYFAEVGCVCALLYLCPYQDLFLYNQPSWLRPVGT